MRVSSRAEQRDLRKRLLQLEAETYRLDIAIGLRQLRQPVAHLRKVPAVLSLLGIKANLVGAMTAIIARHRLGWVVKSIPVALAGVRVAILLRRAFGRRDGRKMEKLARR